MNSQWGLNPPDEGGPSAAGEDRYATWDAAYVLGALSASDRREFEAHLATCPACRDGVAVISGMPALLSQLQSDDVASISAADPATAMPEVSPELLPTLLAAVRWRRRRSRVTAWAAGAAAAAVASIGVAVGVSGVSPTAPPSPDRPQAAASTGSAALPMTQVGTTALTSTVSVSSQDWGTLIDLNCVCLAPPDAHHDTLAMVVVGHDGSRTRLATWVAEPGRTATPAGSIAMPTDHIRAVQVVSADNDQVLLQHTL